MSKLSPAILSVPINTFVNLTAPTNLTIPPPPPRLNTPQIPSNTSIWRRPPSERRVPATPRLLRHRNRVRLRMKTIHNANILHIPSPSPSQLFASPDTSVFVFGECTMIDPAGGRVRQAGLEEVLKEGEIIEGLHGFCLSISD